MSITGWETKPLVVLPLGWLGEESLDSLSNLDQTEKVLDVSNLQGEGVAAEPSTGALGRDDNLHQRHTIAGS